MFLFLLVWTTFWTIGGRIVVVDVERSAWLASPRRLSFAGSSGLWFQNVSSSLRNWLSRRARTATATIRTASSCARPAIAAPFNAVAERRGRDREGLRALAGRTHGVSAVPGAVGDRAASSRQFLERCGPARMTGLANGVELTDEDGHELVEGGCTSPRPCTCSPVTARTDSGHRCNRSSGVLLDRLDCERRAGCARAVE